MTISITDEQVRQLAQTARSYSLALLRWGPKRDQEGAAAIELEHQRRMVALRGEGLIVVLCPVASDTLCGLAIFDAPREQAAEIMAGDPCVKSLMMQVEVYPCHGFPGDALP